MSEKHIKTEIFCCLT